MLFFLQSITALFIGGLIGFLIMGLNKGLMIAGIPIPLVSIAIVLLAFAALFTKDHFNDQIFKLAFFLFIWSIIQMPAIYLFVGDLGAVPAKQTGFITAEAIMPMIRFLTICTLVLSSVASFAQVYIKTHKKDTVKINVPN